VSSQQLVDAPTPKDDQHILEEQLNDIRERLTALLQNGEVSRYALVDCLHDTRIIIRSISLPEPEPGVSIDRAQSVADQIAQTNRDDQKNPRIQRHRMTKEVNRLLQSRNETQDQLEASIRKLIRLTKDAQEHLAPHHIGEGGAFREYAIEELPPGRVLEIRDQYQRLGAQHPTQHGLGLSGRTDSMGIGAGQGAASVHVAYETQSFPGRRCDRQPDNVRTALKALADGDTRTALVINAQTPDGSPTLVMPATTSHGVLPGHVIMVGEETAPLVVDIKRRLSNPTPEQIHDRLVSNLKHLNTSHDQMSLIDELDHLQQCTHELSGADDIGATFGLQAMQVRLKQILAKVSVPTPEATRTEQQTQVRALELAHLMGIEQEVQTFALPRHRGTFAPESSPAAYLGVKRNPQTGEFRYALVNRIGDTLSSGHGYETHKQAYQAGFRSARELNAIGHKLPTLAVRQPEHGSAVSGYQVIGLSGPAGGPVPTTKLGHWMTNRSREAMTTTLTPEQITSTKHWQELTRKTLGEGRSEADRASLRAFLVATLNPGEPEQKIGEDQAPSLSREGITLTGTDNAIRVSDYLLQHGTDEDIRLAVQLQVRASDLQASEKSALIDHLSKRPSCADWIQEGQTLISPERTPLSLQVP